MLTEEAKKLGIHPSQKKKDTQEEKAASKKGKGKSPEKPETDKE